MVRPPVAPRMGVIVSLRHRDRRTAYAQRWTRRGRLRNGCDIGAEEGDLGLSGASFALGRRSAPMVELGRVCSRQGEVGSDIAHVMDNGRPRDNLSSAPGLAANSYNSCDPESSRGPEACSATPHLPLAGCCSCARWSADFFVARNAAGIAFIALDAPLIVRRSAGDDLILGIVNLVIRPEPEMFDKAMAAAHAIATLVVDRNLDKATLRLGRRAAEWCFGGNFARPRSPP